jgi:hypothetical protein
VILGIPSTTEAVRWGLSSEQVLTWWEQAERNVEKDMCSRLSGPALFLRGGCRWKLGEPGIEDFQLVLWRIEEYNTHANSLVDVKNLSFYHQSTLIAGNAHINQRSFRKNVQDVHVTSFAANFRDPT